METFQKKRLIAIGWIKEAFRSSTFMECLWARATALVKNTYISGKKWMNNSRKTAKKWFHEKNPIVELLSGSSRLMLPI